MKPCIRCGMEIPSRPGRASSDKRRVYCSRDCYRVASKVPEPDRFWAKVRVQEDGCWEWAGGLMWDGYGAFHRDGDGSVKQRAHRISWEYSNGPIPSGMLVCHRCDNPRCVRPEHLFLGTDQDNVDDMMSKGRHASHNSRKTHCKRGHGFTPENTYIHNGTRHCRSCERLKHLRHRMAAAAAGGAS